MQQQIEASNIFTLKQFDSSHDSHRKQQINLPDFQVSQVIAANQLIDIRCEEERPFDNFFLRINELGYETNQITNKTMLIGQNDSAKYSHDQNFNFAKLEQKGFRTAKKKKAKRQMLKRIQQVHEQLFELDCQKVELIEYIHKMKQTVQNQLTKYRQIWTQMKVILQKQVESALDRQKLAKLQLQEEQQRHFYQMEQLQKMKQHSHIQENIHAQRTQQMEEQINKLYKQVNHLEAQNQEIKYQLLKLHQCQQKLLNYETEIGNLNTHLEQNSQYIFDLQQKIANCNLDIAERQRQLKREYEQATQHLKEKIQKDYVIQFQRVQEQIKAKAFEEAYQECQMYNLEIEQLKKQLQAQCQDMSHQKDSYEKKISIIQEEKMKLVQQNRNYQSKLHELQQMQMIKSRPKQDDKARIEQLAAKLRHIQDKYRDKQVQLNYYKSLNIKAQIKRQALDQSIIEKSMLKQCAISPSSAGGTIYHKYKPREQLINNILSRIKLRQQGSNASQILQNSLQSSDVRKALPSNLRPISPQSILLQKQKDVRMRNISSKLQQLRSDIRRQIGMMKN